MKVIFKNSMLVTILAGIFVLPMFGFGLFGYPELKESPSVLGVSSDTQQIQKKTIVIEQLDLKLSISYESIQKFYDVIPEEYLSNEYTQYVVAPQELSESGFTFELVDNDLSKDLIVEYSGSSSSSKPQIIDLPILIIKSGI